MPITEKTAKLIWGQFAATCAICRKQLIHEGESGTASLIGEAAHIVGETEIAARGRSPLTKKERNNHENLILLCGDAFVVNVTMNVVLASVQELGNCI